ncbi:MAG: hypothetical protein GY828_04730 [Candidatus Gracilibacteria bacterium]|nr:hypothetical protein [Candidatus Gracilibacteria bacterium]
MVEILAFLLGYLPTALGLYFLAKYAEKGISLFAFVPILQFFLIATLAGFGRTMALFIIAITVISVFYPLLFLFATLLFMFLLFQMGMRTHGQVGFAILGAILPPIGIPVSGFYYRNKIKKEEKTTQQEKKAILDEKREKNSDILSINCDNCSKSLKVKKELAEKVKKGKCPNCGNIINLV